MVPDLCDMLDSFWVEIVLNVYLFTKTCSKYFCIYNCKYNLDQDLEMDRSCGLRSKEKFEVIPLVFLGFCFLYLQHGNKLNEDLEGGDWKVVILFK